MSLYTDLEFSNSCSARFILPVTVWNKSPSSVDMYIVSLAFDLPSQYPSCNLVLESLQHYSNLRVAINRIYLALYSLAAFSLLGFKYGKAGVGVGGGKLSSCPHFALTKVLVGIATRQDSGDST